MVHDGLWDAFNDIHMGITAENPAEQYGISRGDQDEFAASSQQKAERAIADGIFSDEIVPIEVPATGGARLVDSDEAPRAGTTADTLAKLRTAFRREGGTVTVEPKIMGIGPVPAVRKALAKVGLQLSDIDLFELNEAFAAQSLAVLQELDIDHERINPHGGAIALGHPIGASGGRILITLLHEMRRRNSERGVAALCVGGGQGQAAIIRNGTKP